MRKQYKDYIRGIKGKDNSKKYLSAEGECQK